MSTLVFVFFFFCFFLWREIHFRSLIDTHVTVLAHTMREKTMNPAVGINLVSGPPAGGEIFNSEKYCQLLVDRLLARQHGAETDLSNPTSD